MKLRGFSYCSHNLIVYIFSRVNCIKPPNLSGSFTLVPKLSTRQSRSLKCVKWSSEIPNAPRKKPKLTWHATWHHGGKYWQKNLYSLISLTLSNLSLSLSNLSHTLLSLSHSPFTLSLSPLSFHHGRLLCRRLLLAIVLLATIAFYGE